MNLHHEEHEAHEDSLSGFPPFILLRALRVLRGASTIFTLVSLAACGSGGDSGNGITLGTLAYVETECHDTKQGFVEHQRLRIRQGEREPVTVFATHVGPVSGVGGICHGVNVARWSFTSLAREAIQNVVVSPDGTSVVFEVTDEFSTFPPLPLNLPPEQKGIFWVGADGAGLRSLGPPSRGRLFFINNGGGNTGVNILGEWSFSPDGRTVVLVDKASDTQGHESDQLVTVEIATGRRTQVTALPPAVPPAGYPRDAPTVTWPVFIDDRTISFSSSANLDGLNPDNTWRQMTINTETHQLTVPPPIPIALPTGQIQLSLVITGDRPQAVRVPPLGGALSGPGDIFAIDERQNILQLTDFGRPDTYPPVVDVDEEHIYFPASADPLGINRTQNCQIFSIDRLGNNLRQLTNFHETEHSTWGCNFGTRPKGCGLYLPLTQRQAVQDPRGRTLLFYSSCDPFGTNPNGGQIFAIQPDGTGLRQLTNSRGLVKEADGTYSGELPGPGAYGPYAP